MKNSFYIPRFLVIMVASASVSGCNTYWINKGYMDEIAKEPHTARMLNYAVSFPRAADIQDTIPGGLEFGASVSDCDTTDKDGNHKDPHNYIAGWAMAHGGGSISFWVVPKVAPDKAPDAFRNPPLFFNMKLTKAGTFDAGGLSFDVTQWTADSDDGVTKRKGIVGINYEAIDKDGTFVGMQGVQLENEKATRTLTERVLKTLKTMPIRTAKVKNPEGKLEDKPYELMMP